MLNFKKLALILFGLGVVLLITFNFLTTRTSKSISHNEEVEIGGHFELIDQDGNTVSDADLKGKYTLVLFGFSRCPHICPAQLAMLKNSLDEIKNLQAFFITLDPKNDTPEVLKEFKKDFHHKIKMLTGDESIVQNLAKDYKVYVAKHEDPEKFNHSAIIYLMDKNGKYKAHFTPRDEEELLKRLKDYI